MNELDELKKLMRQATVIIGKLDEQAKRKPNIKILTNKTLSPNFNKGESEQMPYLTEGTLRKKTRGNSYIWECRYYDEYRHQKSVFSKNQATCIDKLKKALADRDQRKKNLPPIYTPLTLELWVKQWLEVYKKPNITQQRYKKIVADINNHIKPFDGFKRPLKDITTLDLQALINNIKTTRGNADRTKKAITDLLKAIFSTAFKTQALKHDPTAMLVAPKYKANKGKPLTLQEQDEFLQAIENHPLRNIFMFYVLTGCRRSEALAVKWTDIDFEKNTLTIRGTKTVNAVRVFPLHSSLKALIALIPHETEYLFNYKADYITHQFKRLASAHKLHDLRHTFVTRCAEKGINTKAIASIVGHANDNITRNLYFTALSEFVISETDKLDDTF